LHILSNLDPISVDDTFLPVIWTLNGDMTQTVER